MEQNEQTTDTETQSNRLKDDELLAEIKRLADGHDPPTSSEMKESGKYSPGTYRDRFGSWNAAVERAGFPPRSMGSQLIPEEDLLAEIKRLADGNYPPTIEEMKESGKYSPGTYRNRFGSWNAAVERAGFPPRIKGSRTISEEDLLAEIKRLAEGDEPPTVDEMNENGKYAPGTYDRQFGSWGDAIERAGFAPRTKGSCSITDEELISEIERLAQGDEPPTSDDMNKKGQYSTSLYRDRFGSWSAAIEEAGFTARGIGRRLIPEGDLLAEIERLADGDQLPTSDDMKTSGEYSIAVYYDRFGSWSAAVQKVSDDS